MWPCTRCLPSYIRKSIFVKIDAIDLVSTPGAEIGGADKRIA